MRCRPILLVPALFIAAACGVDRPLAVTEISSANLALSQAEGSAPKFWETGATVAWNAHAATLLARRPSDAVRLLAYISLAQLRAAEAAEATPGPHPPIFGAIGGASAAMLRAFFPLDVADIDAWLAAQAAAPEWPGAKHQDFAAGEAIGRAIAARVVVFARGDNAGLTNPGVPPIGPGRWAYVTGGPIARGGYGSRPFFLTSGNQFLPEAPPVFGSPEYLAALAVVRQISDTRTAAQLAVAQYWNTNASPRNADGMNGIARRLIVEHRRGDAAAARMMFLMNASMFDAAIGCFHAKFTYWYIRPSQADPLITLPIGLPPHPSYPSGHSCVTGAATGILAGLFPSEARYLDSVADEAGLSRLYGGIHYSFDMMAGRALGRSVAELALGSDLSAVAPLP